MCCNEWKRRARQNFYDLKKLFLVNIKGAMKYQHSYVIINWDQTGIPVSNCTMKQAGSKRVEVVGKDDA